MFNQLASRSLPGVHGPFHETLLIGDVPARKVNLSARDTPAESNEVRINRFPELSRRLEV